MGLYEKDGKMYSRVQFEYRGYKRCWGAITVKAARRKHTQFKASILSGEYQEALAQGKRDKHRVTLNGYKDEFLKYYKPGHRESSYKRVKVSLKALCPGLGNKYLDEIIPLHLERYKRKRLSSGRKPATINRELDCLSGLFKMAVRDGKARVSPLSQVKKLTEDNERTWILSDDEEERLLEECDKLNEKVPYLKNLVLVALYSGMRLGEIFALETDHDVDFKAGIVYISPASEKTHRSRKVPMNNTLRAALRSAIKRSPGPWVFSNWQGKKIRILKAIFWQVVEDAGLVKKIERDTVRFRFHDLRHTFGSRLGQAGYDLKTIMELMGHKTEKVALRYQHPTQDHKKQAVMSLDKRTFGDSQAVPLAVPLNRAS